MTTIFPSSTPSLWSPLISSGACAPFGAPASSPFDVLTLPEQRDTPEGLLYTFRFGNGYGAFVLRPFRQQTFEVCLLDCAGEERPTFALPLCPQVQGGLTAAQVSRLLLQAERLERHPRRSLHDRALMSELF